MSTMTDAASYGNPIPSAPTLQEDNLSPVDVRPPLGPSSTQGATSDEEIKAKLDKVLKSDIGVTTLLTRLKQSITSARDFATFLKKRATLEEEHSQGLKKLVRSAQEIAQRSDHRQGTYGRGYDEVNRIQERMADHGLQFAASLYQMSEDLQELASNMERGRKQWKQTGLNAEKRVQDATALAEKAKVKYDSLAEQYDRAKTGDRQGKFGIKVPKSAAQHEEDLHRKVQNADSEYQTKVQVAKSARRELVSTSRPQTLHNLQQLIYECDSGLSLQLQKSVAFNEKLLLSKGLCISPLKDGSSDAAGIKSLREVVQQVDNQKDFNDYILSFFRSPAAITAPEIQYERHPTLAPIAPPSSTTAPASVVAPAPTTGPTPRPSSQNRRQSLGGPPPRQPSFGHSAQIPLGPPPAQTSSQPPAQTKGSNLPPLFPIQFPQESFTSPTQFIAYSPSAPPLLPPQQHGFPVGTVGPSRPPSYSANGYHSNLLPLNPVFGLSLDNLYQRDGTAVPMIVYQCIQAVELFGLDMEGIYRLNGSANHINHMKLLFNNDSSKVDFTDPESFLHDVNSVAGLLKQFLRELPDPLLTQLHYPAFISAARIDNEAQRRDSLHAVINSLPDPNYATLRALILHLNKVQEHSSQNRMNAGNLAICFGPTIMGANSGGNIADAGWQARVIETILLNTFQIFDDD